MTTCDECNRRGSHALNCAFYDDDWTPADDERSHWVAILSSGRRVPFTLAPTVSEAFADTFARDWRRRSEWNLDAGFGADAVSHQVVSVERATA